MHCRNYNRYRLKALVILSWKNAQGIREEQVRLTGDVSVSRASVVAITLSLLSSDIKLIAFRPPVG